MLGEEVICHGQKASSRQAHWSRLILTAFLVLALAAVGVAAPSWRPLPPFGGPVTALAAAQGAGGAPFLYAGTATAGPARSRNGGATWIPPVRVIYGQKAGFECGENEGFVRSADWGTAWTAVAEPGLGGHFTSFAVDPQRPAVLYVGSAEQSGNDFPFCHLARSVNRGRTWNSGATACLRMASTTSPSIPGRRVPCTRGRGRGCSRRTTAAGPGPG